VALPGVSDPTIRLVLSELRDEGLVAIDEEAGRVGTRAAWRRTARDPVGHSSTGTSSFAGVIIPRGHSGARVSSARNAARGRGTDPYAASMDERTRHALGGSGGRLLAWLPALAWAALIFVSSAQPSISFVPDPWLDFLVRKSGHMGIFGILALLIWLAVRTTTGRRRWAWALGLAVLYAVTDEWHQGFASGREASARDVAFDAAGAVIALTALAIVRAVRPRRASGPG